MKTMDGPRSRRLTAAAAAMLFVGGCQKDGEPFLVQPSPDEPWSTKQQSIAGGAAAPEAKGIPLAVAEQTLPPAPAPAPAPTARAAAIGLLVEATESTNPLLRGNALECLQVTPDELETPVRLALADDNRFVRFVAAMIIGRQQMKSLAPLVEPLLDDPSESVRAGAIFAMRRCGEPVDLNPLASMIMSPDPEVRANVAMILGELGDPSALPMLREATKVKSARVTPARRRIVDLQIAEAMVKLGADEELEVIRAALFTPEDQAEITVLACQLIGQLRDTAYATALLDKAMRTGRLEEPPEVRMAAVGALARMDPERAPREVPLEYVDSDRFELRLQAAVTLGWIRDSSLRPTLMTLMKDSNALVQVAAAGAVLRGGGH